MNDPILKKAARAIASTRSDEINCGECFEKIGRYVELVRDGKAAENLMPLVNEHLERCHDCREEYEALLEALREIG